jgi:hypothetical protein
LKKLEKGKPKSDDKLISSSTTKNNTLSVEKIVTQVLTSILPKLSLSSKRQRCIKRDEDYNSLFNEIGIRPYPQA